MATFHFDLVSPEKLAFSGEVDQVDIPGIEGDFGVLAGHAPDLRIDVVLADTGHVPDPESLRRTAQSLGAELVIADIADEERDLHHAPDKLAKVYREIFG